MIEKGWGMTMEERLAQLRNLVGTAGAFCHLVEMSVRLNPKAIDDSLLPAFDKLKSAAGRASEALDDEPDD